jgi:hypothetical protein
MMTEPGIIGKIGMNSSGLGTALNLLSSDRKTDGVPIHIMLRAFLDCHTLQEVDEKVKRFGLGKASAITVGDSKGDVRHLEFYPLQPQCVPVDPVLGVVYRTNHYLSPSLHHLNSSSNPIFANSFYRYQRAGELITQLQRTKTTSPLDAQDMLKVLTDQREQNTGCIWSSYKFNKRYDFNIGTVCTVVMDLNQKKMTFLKGPSSVSWSSSLSPSSPLWLTTLSPLLLNPQFSSKLTLTSPPPSCSSASSSTDSTSTSTSSSVVKETKKKRKTMEGGNTSVSNGVHSEKKQKKLPKKGSEGKKREPLAVESNGTNDSNSPPVREEEMTDKEKIENSETFNTFQYWDREDSGTPKPLPDEG